jgi:hypothetical protein
MNKDASLRLAKATEGKVLLPVISVEHWAGRFGSDNLVRKPPANGDSQISA